MRHGNIFYKHLLILFIVFVLSRICFYQLGVSFNYSALADYWQLLDAKTLRQDLLSGIWSQAALPPLCNVVAGCLLKLSGSYSSFLFPLFFMVISFANALLLLSAIL